MNKIEVYEKALKFSKNTLIGLSHKYKRQTFLTDDDIMQNVATDCFGRSLKKEMSEREIVSFCKYRTLQNYFLDRKHKLVHCDMSRIQTDSVVSKNGHFKSVESLKKIELVKKTHARRTYE